MNPNQPDQWFAKAIKNGLKGLLALRLDGTPAADTITVTRDVWVTVLWQGRAWQESLDTARINQAFINLCTVCTRWPAPAEFTRHLPARKLPRALPSPKISKEQQRANLKKIKQIVGGLS